MNFTTVYDIMDQSVNYSLASKSFLFFIAGIIIIFFTKGKRNQYKVYKKLFIIGIAFVSFSVLWAASIAIFEYVSIYSSKKAIIEHTYKIVEGTIENYQPTPYEGHVNEKFDVTGVHFEFSDFTSGNFGYHNAVPHGGVIKERLHVRITYMPVDSINPILKLEISKI